MTNQFPIQPCRFVSYSELCKNECSERNYLHISGIYKVAIIFVQYIKKNEDYNTKQSILSEDSSSFVLKIIQKISKIYLLQEIFL